MSVNRDTIKEMMRFGITGVVATAIHYGVYLVLNGVTDVNAAYTTGYVVSFAVNYILSAQFTFKEKKSVKNGFGFCGAHMFNYFLQIGLLNLAIRLGIDKSFAPVPVYCIAIPVNFLIVRFVFRKLS